MTQVYFQRSTTKKIFLDHHEAVVNDLAEASATLSAQLLQPL